MNSLKRSIIVVLMFAVLMSILAIPVLALEENSSHYTNVSDFEELYNGSDLKAYVRAAQRFLLCYGGVARSNIISGGGVDGGYGYYTEQAVKAYQKEKWPYNAKEQDGRVGPKTWEKIAVDLEYSPADVEHDDLCVNAKKVLYVDIRADGCSYYNYNGSESGGTKDLFIVSK